MHIETKLIHAGEPEPRIGGAVTLPIFQSSTFQYTGQDNYDALKYIRMNNTPNHIALHQKLSALENAEAGLVTASGMAAITTTFLALLSLETIFWPRTACTAAPSILSTRIFAL
jgi:cystathionine beta-lyase/cystathionine gamma-synthase